MYFEANTRVDVVVVVAVVGVAIVVMQRLLHDDADDLTIPPGVLHFELSLIPDVLCLGCATGTAEPSHGGEEGAGKREQGSKEGKG